MLCGFVGGVVAGCEVGQPPNIVSLADALGGAAHGVVAPSDVRWEPSHGWMQDFVGGRWVLFLASDEPNGPRDVWRARVRLSPEGRPLELAEAHNLTSTPLGDDHALIVRDARAAFATFAYGQEQSVTLLNLAGEPSAPTGLADRVTAWLTNLQQTGTGEGIGRIDVTLEQPALRVGLSLDPRELTIDLADAQMQSSAAAVESRSVGAAWTPKGGAARRHTALDYDRGELGPAQGMHAEVVRHLPKRLVLWAVDTVRAVPWIGPAPVAWLEEAAFAVRDAANRLTFRLQNAGSSTDQLAESTGPAPLGASGHAGSVPSSTAGTILGDARTAGVDGLHWPPPVVPSIWKTTEPGEGEWQLPRLSWMKKLEVPGVDPTQIPPAMLRTFVRPDPERPYTRVILVAMDMRQLDLDMEAGTEDPKPMTGGHGPGRIPRDTGVQGRVVAAFNGAFKTEHGNYGMMVHNRVLLPPQPNAASVIVLRDQRVGFGTWPNTHDVSGIEGVADGEVVSFRQNLDALVDGDEVNPMGRALWGYTLPGSGMQTERSGLCVTGAGNLVYAWGDDVSGTALGKAMKMADCTYAMHLDMNPHHTGFIFASLGEAKGKSYHSELLTPLMTVSPDRYIEYAPKDFFYVLLHEVGPPTLPTASGWQPDPGLQPVPAWMPGLWTARTDVACGAVAASGGCDSTGRVVAAEPSPVELLDVEPRRAAWRIRGGMREPDAKTGATPLHDLGEDDAGKVMLSIGMGVALERHPRGLATDGKMVFPIATMKDVQHGSVAGEKSTARAPELGDDGALIADADGSLSILRGDELTSIGLHADMVELPLVVDAGLLLPEAGRSGPSGPRAALGVTPQGRVLIARGSFDNNAPLAEGLRRAGCTRAVALDRGTHSLPFVHRTGTGLPPRSRYDETVLYGLAVPLKPRGFRFDAQSGAGSKGAL
jgi:hypothetical protein